MQRLGNSLLTESPNTGKGLKEIFNMSNLKGEIYLFLRRNFTFRNWERFYQEIESSLSFNLEKEYLKRIIWHAFNNVPYYRDIFEEFGLVKSGEVFLGRFEELPVLTKSMLKENFTNLISKDFKNRKWFKNSSGGSTGIPQTFIQDKEFREWNIATQTFYFRKLLKTDYAKVKKVILWGSERDIFGKKKTLKAKISNWLSQNIFLNTFRVSEKDWLRYIELINKKKPHFIKGYAGSLYEIAKLAKQKGLKVWQPRLIYSSAETLRPFMRETIEEVFGCKVYDFYGSREVGSTAGECQRGKLHIFNFNNLVEVVDEKNKSVRPGEMGRVLITTLHNFSMPLIRYEVEDTAILGGQCDCGIETPTLERITGRITDHFKNKKGELIHGEYFTHLFYFREWVKAFQVVQEELDKLKIFFSGMEANQKEVKEIEEKIRLVMGQDCRIGWEKVKEIPPTPQGKYLFTRSLIYQTR